VAELDSDGLVTGMHQTVYLYDAKERLVKRLIQDPQGGSLLEETTYTFPGEPATVTTSYTHGSVTDVLSQSLDYDIRGRQTGLTASLSAGGVTLATGSTLYSYDALGRPASRTSSVTGGATITTEDSYTLRGNLAARTVKKGGVTLFAESLTYDGASGIAGVAPSYTGLITVKQETWSFPGNVTDSRTEGYAYDYAGRMTRSGSASSPVTYTYDARGNVLTAGGNSYTYSGDKLTSLTPSGQSAVSFTHDTYGRMTTDGLSGSTIGYNHMDLPAKISQNGSDLVKYSYLADGSKSKAENGSGVGLVYRGSLIYRKAAGGSLTLEGASLPEGRLTVNGVRWHVKDHLGSVRAVVDGSTGNLLAVTDYDAYGEDAANSAASPYLSPAPSGETFRERFTGKEDQGPDFGTAYTDFGARQYSPTLRRWLVPDPLSEKYYGVSPYAYCAGNPVNLVDPEGRTMTDYFNTDGVFIYTDNQDNGKIRIASEAILETAQEMFSSDNEIASYLSDNSVSLKGAYKEGLINDNSALKIFNHYNKTDLPLAPKNSISGYFSFNTDLTISVNIKKSLTPDKQGFTMSSYFDINSALNIHEGEGHYQMFKKIGPEEYSSIPACQREIIAIEIQMKDPSWKKTTEKFQRGVKKYYQINYQANLNLQ
jgi:RHS repeat-associated protein